MQCPKCHFEQPGTNKDCIRCGIVFARYKAPPEIAIAPPSSADPKQAAIESAVERMKGLNLPAPKPSLFSQAFRLLRWAIVIGCVFAIGMMLQQPPPPLIAVDPEAAQKIAVKMQAVQEATSQGQPVTVELTEAELNVWLQSHLALTPSTGQPGVQEVQSTMKDLRINLIGDQVRAYTVFNFHGKDMSLLLEGRVRVENGRLRFDATNGRLGSLPIPHATLGSAVKVLFDAPTNREKFTLPPQLNTIAVQNSQLLVSYKAVQPQ